MPAILDTHNRCLGASSFGKETKARPGCAQPIVKLKRLDAATDSVALDKLFVRNSPNLKVLMLDSTRYRRSPTTPKPARPTLNLTVIAAPNLSADIINSVRCFATFMQSISPAIYVNTRTVDMRIILT